MPVTEKQMENISRLKKSLEEYKAIYESQWQEIIRYLAPSYASVSIGKPGTESAPSYQSIYDTTALEASNVLADGLQGYAFGRTISWFRFRLEEAGMMENDENKLWLQSAERHIYEQFNKSNFYDESRAFLRCGADFGTAIMTFEHDEGREIPVFHALHPGTYAIEEDRFGMVNVLIRTFWLSKTEAEEKFDKKNLPEQIVSNEDAVSELYEFHQYIGPSSRIETDIPGDGEYVSIYWAALDSKKACKEERFEHKPFFAWRWAKNPCGSPWGTDNPGMVQVPNIKMLQSLVQDYIRISQLAGRPPIKKTEGLKVNFYPSGMTDLAPGADFAAVQVTGDLAWTGSLIQMIKAQINSAYHKDFFLALMMSQDRTKTATEVQALVDEKSAIMSAFFSRLAHEFIEPVLEAVFDLEVETTRMPAPPPSLSEKQLKIDFISPLAMMQKRSHGLNTTKQFLGEILGIAEISPTIMDKINTDGFVDVAGESYDVDHRIIRGDDEVNKLREVRMQMQMQQMERENQLKEAQVGAQTYTATTKAPEKGSPADKQGGMKR
ncbi:MAG: portal protein [Sphaerochaeta sp.]|nr:portal protein [Sphaerochaeta sp.]